MTRGGKKAELVEQLGREGPLFEAKMANFQGRMVTESKD